MIVFVAFSSVSVVAFLFVLADLLYVFVVAFSWIFLFDLLPASLLTAPAGDTGGNTGNHTCYTYATLKDEFE